MHAALTQLAAGGYGQPAPTLGGPQLFAGGGISYGNEARYDCRLYSGLRRAAPEIYTRIRSQGSSSVRDWLQQSCPGGQKDHRWTDLWNAACSVDYALARLPNVESALAYLASEDIMEIHLRRMAAFIYERRTRDTVGATTMLALAAPGSNADVGPEWLITEATLHSRSEHTRNERVAAAGRLAAGRGEGSRGRGNGASSSGDGGDGSGDVSGGRGGRGRGRGGSGGGGGRAAGRGRPQP